MIMPRGWGRGGEGGAEVEGHSVQRGVNVGDGWVSLPGLLSMDKINVKEYKWSMHALLDNIGKQLLA